MNGQKLIVLKPFGPVQCVFDFDDTEPIPNATEVMEEADLIQKYTESLQQAQGDLANKTMETLGGTSIILCLGIDVCEPKKEELDIYYPMQLCSKEFYL